MEIHREERGLTFSRIERKTPVVRPAVQSILHSRRQRGGEGLNGQVVSLKNQSTAPINSRLNVVVRSPIPFAMGRNGCCPSQGS